jgi:hypothetical protein
MTIQPDAIGGGSLAAPRVALRGLNLALLALALAPFFWAAWQIEPLYTENQNTKFLHGLANAGVGFLREDWMAQTKDGLPAFTLLSELIYRAFGPGGFYLACLASYALYLFCALVIYRRVTEKHGLPFYWVAPFLALFFIIATISDPHEVFLGGFAEQYILSGYFQTADFGVFLICGVLLFEKQRIAAALACLLLAAVMHAAYVVPGAALAAIFLLYEIRQGRAEARGGQWLKWALFALTFAALASISLALKLHFTPTDPQLHREAHRLLTQIRIPRHADPWDWIDINVAIQFAACFLAAYLLLPGRLRFVILLGGIALAIFTLGAFLPNMATYRLVAPWRLSVAIVPLASIALGAIAIAALKENGFWPPAKAKQAVIVSAAVIAICTAIGATISVYKAPKHDAYLDFVRANRASGQLYITATQLKNFRLAAAVPHYVSHKTHPYQDFEVMEWTRRLKVADELFRSKSMDCERLRRVAVEERVTHVLARSVDPAPSCDFASLVFDKDGDRIFRLQGAKRPE